MKMLTIIGCLMLAACANPYRTQNIVSPYAIDAYPVWRQCRVDYEFAHKLPMTPEIQNSSVGAEIRDMMNDARLFGPKMDKDVDSCMSQRGYAKLANL